MPTDRYEALSVLAQVHRLRQVAFTAVEHYPFEVLRIRLLLHAYNTTFRVDTTDGRQYALRMSTAGLRQIAPAYLANSVLRLGAFMQTGVYRRDVPGVVAISN